MFFKILSLIVYFKHYQVKGSWSFLGGEAQRISPRCLLIMEIHYSVSFPDISLHPQNLRANVREGNCYPPIVQQETMPASYK